jgi:peptide subunit release factor RF-3
MEAASFVDSFGNSKVYLRSDFSNSSEIELLEHINAELLEHDWPISWNQQRGEHFYGLTMLMQNNLNYNR